MERMSHYIGYMKEIQKNRKKRGKRSTKESVLRWLKNLKNREFTMMIPITENNSNE